ncbi:hypothetical protein RJ639_022811 [Escallonia herrerae]|uniref:Zinc finger CCCH domain-containing protein 13 n=1 Tax=Escallonia herrerae TaxID=1293975 RepID=A0AA88V002_9ASTE|nr:hypothetical protein RJ639_022811 [Escallonia herrerae]
MPRSSRSKSHKQSKHSAKEAAREAASESEEDVRMKDRSTGEEVKAVRVLRDLASGEKRKLSSQAKEGKESSGHGNGDAEGYVGSKRRKEKERVDVGGGSDRWNGGGDERDEGVKVEKEFKESKSRDSKGLVDSKSRASKRHETGGEKEEENVGSAVEKEESKGGSRVESRRKSEKDSVQKEAHQSKDLKEEGEGSWVREREEMVHTQDELQIFEPEKETEKKSKRRGDGSSEKEKCQDDSREPDERRLSSRGDRAKDGRYKDDRHKDGSYGDKHRDDGDRENKHREDKYREDGEKDNRHKDGKYREDGERSTRHRDDKYRDDGDRDSRHRDDKYREDGNRDNRRREDRYREDGERENRRRDDKYREGGDRDDRHKDDRYKEDGDRDNRQKEEKHREDLDRESRHKDGKQRDDIDRDKRIRDVMYRDEHSSRDRASESDTKRLRDEGNAADLQYRKSSYRDGSPNYDDRVTKYKDDKGRRRGNDKEDHTDIRSRNTKEQRPDAEKRPTSNVKPDLVTDRGRSNSRNADIEITLNHNRRRSSPSSASHAPRDHYRHVQLHILDLFLVSKQEEAKYRDYGYEDRRYNITSNREFPGAASTDKISSSRSLEKPLQKDDGHVTDLPERRPRSDTRPLPLPLMDKSPSSTNTDRRYLNRSDVRRSLDVEEFGPRSGGSKDVKDYLAKEGGRGSRELPMEAHPGDDLSQAEGDNQSVSSPFTRNSHFSGNSRSLLPPPPPPFRTGVDSPLIFGSSEDDNRIKPNHRHRRFGDLNMGRGQGNAWKGVPNWPAPVANGFMPFPHGPPPVGFHPMMSQFPAPPMFRPSMELNMPYHIPDTERFSGHGRQHGWRNPVDDPPPLHGWDANNGVFSDESHVYGRLDWDHNRNQMSNRGWETSGHVWKGQNSGVSTDMQSVSQKEDSANLPADEVLSGHSGQQNEQNLPDLQADSFNFSQSSDALQKITPEAPKASPDESPDVSKMSIKDDSHLFDIYLSKLDISVDLAQPELYGQCTSLMDMEDQNTVSDDDDHKILYVEEVVEAKVKTSDKASSASLFAAMNDSVFQKAISLYKRQKEELRATNGEFVSFPIVDSLKSVPTCAQSEAGKPGNLVSECDEHEEEVCPVTVSPKLDEPVVADTLEKAEELIPTVDKVQMEVDPVSRDAVDIVVDDVVLKNVEAPDACFPGCLGDANGSSNVEGNHKEGKLLDTKCGALLFSDVSSEACEAVMPESIESGSVNLSRIHHSPESTH